MEYRPIIVVDDDDELIRGFFKLKAVKANVEIIDFATWDKTKEFLETEIEVSSPALKLHELVGCALTPHELNALDPVLAKLEAVEA